MFIGGHAIVKLIETDCDLVLPYLMWYEHNELDFLKKN